MVGQEAIANTHRVAYPFIKEVVSLLGEDGPYETTSWRPGVRFVDVFTPPDGLDQKAEADGVGAQTLTVVSRHKPGRYPERVFYTRQWVDPDGKTFGKGRLFIATAEKFRRLAKGYAHDYTLTTKGGA